MTKEVASRMGIPTRDIHGIAEKKFNHLNFIYYSGRFHYIDHMVDFFKGTSSDWDPHIFDESSAE